MNRKSNWGYPVEGYFHKSSAPKAPPPTDQAQDLLAYQAQRRRVFFHLKIILLSAVCVSAIRMLFAFVEYDDLGTLKEHLSRLVSSEPSAISPVRPLLAAVPEMKQASQELWRCRGNFTNNPQSGENCAQVDAQSRADSDGNKYITGPWTAELVDEDYQ